MGVGGGGCLQPEATERVDAAPASTRLNPLFALIAEGVKAEGVKAGGHPAGLGARQPLAPLLLPSGLTAAGHCPPSIQDGPAVTAPRSPQQPGMTKRR